MAQRILRPLDYRDLFDELFDLYKSNFLLFFGISAVIMLPVNMVAYSFGRDAATVMGFLMLPITFVATAATTQAVSESYLGRTPTILASYRILRGRIWPFIATMIATQILIGCALMLCVIPGIYFSVWYAFVAQVFVLEGKAWGDARARSKDLSHGHRGWVFGVLFLSGILAFFVSAVLEVPASALGEIMRSSVPTPVAGMIVGLASGLGTALATPISVVASVLLYYDIRVRKEGFDIEMLAAGIGAKPDPEPVPQDA